MWRYGRHKSHFVVHFSGAFDGGGGGGCHKRASQSLRSSQSPVPGFSLSGGFLTSKLTFLPVRVPLIEVMQNTHIGRLIFSATEENGADKSPPLLVLKYLRVFYLGSDKNINGTCKWNPTPNRKKTASDNYWIKSLDRLSRHSCLRSTKGARSTQI